MFLKLAGVISSGAEFPEKAKFRGSPDTSGETELTTDDHIDHPPPPPHPDHPPPPPAPPP